MTDRNRERLANLTPERRAQLASIKADLKRPEIVEQHEADHANFDREYRETGTIATEGGESTAAEFLPSANSWDGCGRSASPRA